MARIRVHQLKKDLNLEYADLAALCDRLKIEYKSHPIQKIQPSSTIEEADAIRLQASLKPGTPAEAAKTQAPAQAKPVEKQPSAPPAPPQSARPAQVQAPPQARPEPQAQAPAAPSPLKETHPEPVPERREKPEAPAEPKKIVELVPNITVKDLADRMSLSIADVIKALFIKGIVTTVNQVLELETAEMVVHEFDMEARLPSASAADERKLRLKVAPVSPPSEADGKLKPRPPVVTVMGHVDHGKTSLLDAIRKTRVTESEAGGITQSIGAYKVQVGEREIVFLDTPGHEAFTAMRARGAQVTDIVILVVAADDGIMPQTVEAIHHAKASEVQILVAVNKIDKEGADAERVKQQLTEHELVPEEWGGQTVIVPVSAKTGKGIDDLLEMIVLLADMLELKAHPDKKAEGVVIESRLDKGTGPVGSVLIQNGTLHRGDYFIAGGVYGKVRAMTNDRGQQMKSAPPSTPVEIIGFNEVPNAGDFIRVVKNEKVARQLALENKEEGSSFDKRSTRSRISLSNLYEKVKEGKLKELNVVIKADTQGSIDAICQSLNRLTTDRIQLKILHAAPGEISEWDILLASASNALAICFNVKPDANARRVAILEQIEIRYYEIIYKLIEDVEKAMDGLLEPEMVEIPLGEAEVRATFRVGKLGTVAGCYIRSGKCERNAFARVWRNNQMIATGRISTLKRFKDDVKEVTTGYECGVALNNFDEFQEGDRLEIFVVQAAAGAKTR